MRRYTDVPSLQGRCKDVTRGDTVTRTFDDRAELTLGDDSRLLSNRERRTPPARNAVITADAQRESRRPRAAPRVLCQYVVPSAARRRLCSPCRAVRLSQLCPRVGQVDVTNITIRYLDSSHGHAPYSISLHLKSLHVRSG